VHAFEPANDTRQYLIDNCRSNGFANVQVHPYAAGETDGEVDFHVGATSTLNSRAFREESVVVRVNERRIDDLVASPVKLVKIDVEGHELNVLAGMRRILAENPALCLLVEWGLRLQTASGAQEVTLPEVLFENGFRIAPVTEPNRFCTTIDQLYSATRIEDSPKQRVNLVATRG
jgi:FkbM family methyltransferase